MKQRLGIAQALLHDPDLIILDEPTTGLDPQGMKEIRELVISLSKEKGKTIFISSHLLHEIELISNRMIIINKGKKIIEGYVKDLLDKEKAPFVFQVSDIEKASKVLKSLNLIAGEDYQISDAKLHISTEKITANRLNKIFIENEIDVFAFYPKKTLEEYFLEITQGAK
jgi:ABC-2 type transport system ATP-binding protein